MGDDFETYLYQKYRAIYVSPLSQLATTLNLLDIFMIKKDFVSGRRELVLVGSMLDLGTESSVEAQKELDDERKRFWNGQVSETYTERKLFSWASADSPQIEEVFSSKSVISLLAGVAEADVHFSKDRELKCKIGQVDTAMVDWQLLGNKVAKHPPKWQPNLDDWRMKTYKREPSWFGNSDVELWVVHHILYTNMVELTSTDSSSAGGKVCLVRSKTPQTEASESRNSGLEVTREINDTQKLELVAAEDKSSAQRVPDKFMIAFRLIGFRFDSTGKVKDYMKDPGDDRPIHRASDNGESHSYQRAQIRYLYTVPAPDFNSDEDDSSDEDDDRSTKTLNLQRLLIVNNDGVPLDTVQSATPNSEGSTLDRSTSSILAVDNCY